jgi:hypothetical protein
MTILKFSDNHQNFIRRVIVNFRKIAIAVKVFGGVEGDRTPDLCNAIAALSQLSYDPKVNYRIINYALPMSKSVINYKLRILICEQQKLSFNW